MKRLNNIFFTALLLTVFLVFSSLTTGFAAESAKPVSVSEINILFIKGISRK